MAYVLVSGVVVIRQDIPVPGGVLGQLRAELRDAKAQRDALVARIAAIKAELLSAGDHATGQIKRAGNPAPLLITGARYSAGTFSSQVGCPRW